MKILPTSSFIDVLNATFNNSSINPPSAHEFASIIPFLARISTLTAMILIDTCALFGNLLVICAFFRTRRLQTVTNYFIASLAFADALVAIFVLPLSIYYYQRNRSWKLGLILCDLWVSSDVLLCTSSILNLTCISVDRYMAITRPLTYTAYRSKFLARVMILLVWIVSIVITCPPIFGWRDSNRRHTVENEHKCDLNTARGYVVYSALGSFYIPAVVMIFVYIRIFMVVYDRENLIKKFHDKNSQSSTQLANKPHQNGLVSHRNLTDIASVPMNSSNVTNSNSLCNCRFFFKCFRKKSGLKCHGLSSANHESLKIQDKLEQTHCLQQNNHYSNVLISTAATKKSKIDFICRPCSLSTKKNMNLADEISNYRKNYFLPGRASEYRFRTGDSPCYQRKAFVNLPSSVNPNRSQSLEQVPMMLENDNQRRPLSMTNVINSGQSHPTTYSSHQENEEDENFDKMNSTRQAADVQLCNTVCHSSETSDEIMPLCTPDEVNQTNVFAKRSPTILTYSSSIGEQIYSNNTNYHERQSTCEGTRIHQKKKSRTSKTNPTTILLENIRQQYQCPAGNTSLRSNISSTSTRRLNETISLTASARTHRSSKCCRFCFFCLKPFNNWCQMKRKNFGRGASNHSITYDDDDEEKISSNDGSNRLPPLISSNYSLKTIETANISPKDPCAHSNNLLSNISTAHTHHDVHRRERIRFLKEQKTAKTLAVVVGGFVLFWLPFFIMYVIPPETYELSVEHVLLITWLGYCNSVINPFIYAYCSKQFRMAFWNITFGIFFKKTKPIVPVSKHKNPPNRTNLNT